MAPHLLGVTFGLLSALVWGSGDYSGGLATRRNSQFQVLALSALSGLLVLLLLVAVTGERLPAQGNALWALAAGLGGALGIASFYRALSLGRAAMVAPLAAVVGAALPVLFSLARQGLPPVAQRLGFALAFVGIWQITGRRGEARAAHRLQVVLATLAGLGFGSFFILLGQVDGQAIFAPLLLARLATLLVALAVMVPAGMKMPALRSNPIALLAGALDAGGNIFYFLASQFTRLDVAAVLASLYPATTVFLAWAITREQVTGRQWLGVAICLLAVVLIVL